MASDYLMRQIEDMARLCSEVLFAKHTEPLPVFDEQGNVTENGVLYGRLRMLCSGGRVNEAENLLFDRLDAPGGEALLPAAVQFYKDIQNWEDAALEQAGFSRAEIRDGLAEVQARLQSAQMERSDNP
ncbi:MAG: DUF6483 family protein [Ruthenibacterium sp.]|jgi:hypothetical protein|nr:hypothetical protein [Oscillospiraceae bacterium]